MLTLLVYAPAKGDDHAISSTKPANFWWRRLNLHLYSQVHNGHHLLDLVGEYCSIQIKYTCVTCVIHFKFEYGRRTIKTCTNTVMQETVLAGFENKRKLLLKYNVKRKQLYLYIRKAKI